MKRPLMFWMLIATMALTGLVTAGNRHRHQRTDRASTGVGLRGSYWDVRGKNATYLHGGTDPIRTVDVSGFGGQVYFFSRVEKQLYVEFLLGAVGSVESQAINYVDDEVQVAAVMPTLLGLKYDLVRDEYDSALRPYVGAGGGLSWASDIQVVERGFYEEQVEVDSEARPGMYAGGGIDFLIGDHFLLNYDVKYHWVDFDNNRFEDGWEFAIGFAITWGR